MRDPDDTLANESSIASSDGPARPAAIAVFVAGRPAFHAIDLVAGTCTIGRVVDAGLPDDPQASRKHATIALAKGKASVRDLGSTNGTYVDGQRVVGEATAELPCVVRTGHTIFLVVPDARPLAGGVTVDREGVVGPALRHAFDRIERAAARTDLLLITGDTGTGKERAARHFHEAGGRRRGDLVAVNCATIAHGVAERLLFGTVKGAYSGAESAADGYIVAADRGTLFLDEVGELDPLVQPKLLRVLETKEVTPLGASKPQKVSTRFVFATLRKLRAAVHDGKFRADLFYRISREEVELPSLRDRREEIPWLVAFAIERAAPGTTAHARLVEACLLRPWPGNVRELLSAIERATIAARDDGKDVVRDAHLPEGAGLTGAVARPAAPKALTREAIEAAIAEHAGNFAAAARHLGLHRSQFYRLLEQLGISRD